MSRKLYIFRDGRLIRTFDNSESLSEFKRDALPNDVFISWVGFVNGKRMWYRKDFTSVSDSDVPDDLKLSLILLGENV
jgi:hypothetical protein